jgi:DNA-binding Lrp family transcriptional regulator
MDAPYSPLEFSLLNDYQRDFPLVTEPYAELARQLGTSPATLLAVAARLQRRGAIGRIGAVFAPWRVGVSTLAAVAVPPARLEAVAALVSARPAVNHNYQREHDFNLWFVATAADEAALAAVLAGIERDAGSPVLSLPLVEQYHIDLGFDLCHGGKERPSAGRFARRPLSADEQRLVGALQAGLPLVARPFAAIGERAAMSEAAVLGTLAAWLAEGIVKRFGVVVRHHELGYKANAMVVFAVADDAVAALGARLAGEPGVTLCYRRQRHLPDWPYNLYCMVHGRSREEAAPVIERLRAIVGSPGQVLFSTRRFKQQGARYFDDRPS